MNLINPFMTEAEQSKSMDWFLYNNDLRHERVKGKSLNRSRFPALDLLFSTLSLKWFFLVYGDIPLDLTVVTLKLLIHKTSQNTTTSAMISGGGDSTRSFFSCCFIFASIAAVPAFRGMRAGLVGTGNVVCSTNSGLTAGVSLWSLVILTSGNGIFKGFPEKESGIEGVLRIHSNIKK